MNMVHGLAGLGACVEHHTVPGFADEDVGGRLRIDFTERQRPVALEHLGRRRRARRDGAEQAVSHMVILRAATVFW
jgi:hypothetical protein